MKKYQIFSRQGRFFCTTYNIRVHVRFQRKKTTSNSFSWPGGNSVVSLLTSDSEAKDTHMVHHSMIASHSFPRKRKEEKKGEIVRCKTQENGKGQKRERERETAQKVSCSGVVSNLFYFLNSFFCPRIQSALSSFLIL